MRSLLFLLFVGSALNADPMPIIDAKPLHEAFTVPIRDFLTPVIAHKMPPQGAQEIIPPQPYNDALWIPGYYAWNEAQSDFVWVCGVWRRPPPNHQWISGSWVPFQGGWAWQSGFWSQIPSEKIVFIAKAPPQPVNDSVPAAPGDGYFWVRGYWDYTANNFSWLTGRFEQLNPKWVMNPARYVWRASGYVFVPMHWDFPLDVRGKAYSCARLGAPLVLVEPALIIRQLYCWYPDYIDLFCHWNFIHPDFFDSCDCLPPWWFWDSWWTFPCGDLWGLWWWWGHPGFFPPFWLPIELSLKLAPPSPDMLLLFSKMHKPHFDLKQGDKDFRPQGPKGVEELPKPSRPDNITPGGQVTLPPLPGGSVVIPPPPLDQRPPVTPPSYEPNYPDYEPPVYVPPRGQRPPEYIPPRDRNPPDIYIPPRDRRPPDYIPPRDRNPPDYIPPRDRKPPDYIPPRDRTPQWPPSDRTPPSKKPPHDSGSSGTGPNYVPPERGRGQYPSYQPSTDTRRIPQLQERFRSSDYNQNRGSQGKGRENN